VAQLYPRALGLSVLVDYETKAKGMYSRRTSVESLLEYRLPYINVKSIALRGYTELGNRMKFGSHKQTCTWWSYMLRHIPSTSKIFIFKLRKEVVLFEIVALADRLCGLLDLATDPEVRVRFPALPAFLRSSGSGAGSTQPRDYNWGATWSKNSGSGLESREYGRRNPPRWLSDILYQKKSALTSLTSGGRSVGMVRSWTQATEFSI
jgi:hypothetical protein